MGTGQLSGKPNKLQGMTCNGLASRPGGVEILLAASCYRNRDKLQQLWAISSKASLFILMSHDFEGHISFNFTYF